MLYQETQTISPDCAANSRWLLHAQTQFKNQHTLVSFKCQPGCLNSKLARIPPIRHHANGMKYERYWTVTFKCFLLMHGC